MRNPHHIPRVAYCTGCGKIFDKMHLMINHRRTFRCGGRFLPDDERELVLAAKTHWQRYDTLAESDGDHDQERWHYFQWRDMTSRFFLLRKRRLDESLQQQG